MFLFCTFRTNYYFNFYLEMISTATFAINKLLNLYSLLVSMNCESHCILHEFCQQLLFSLEKLLYKNKKDHIRWGQPGGGRCPITNMYFLPGNDFGKVKFL